MLQSRLPGLRPRTGESIGSGASGERYVRVEVSLPHPLSVWSVTISMTNQSSPARLPWGAKISAQRSRFPGRLSTQICGFTAQSIAAQRLMWLLAGGVRHQLVPPETIVVDEHEGAT